MRVGHYVNQFFAGIGGEEHANVPPAVRDGPVGPGRMLDGLLGPGSVVSTLFCGDNFAGEHRDETAAAVREWLQHVRPDAVIAGPAFSAGRYGHACAQVCRVAAETGIPAVTGMHPENPGVLVYRPAYIVPTGGSAVDMKPALIAMQRLVRHLISGDALGPAERDGYLPRGIRRPGMRDEIGAERAVAMLVAKITGTPFRTELPVDAYEFVPPAPGIADLSRATIAVVTTGAIVPRGNPDHLKRCSETRWVRYALGNRAVLTPEEFECVHGGFYNQMATDNPNVVLPLDVLRDLERDRAFARLVDFYCTTTGNDQRLSDCRRNGAEIGEMLRSAQVDGVLLVAT